MLLELLDSEGFVGMYNFVYLPVDFQRWVGLGYAFINLVTHEVADRARAHFDGFDAWVVESNQVSLACFGDTLQGLTELVERYRNSPVMHELIPGNVKPVIFQNGQRLTFPAPTKRVVSKKPIVFQNGQRITFPAPTKRVRAPKSKGYSNRVPMRTVQN